MIDLVYRKHKNYYPQDFLEECKYVAKEKKTSNIITGDMKISSDDSDKEDSDDRILMRKIRCRGIFYKSIRNFLDLGLESSIS